MTAETAQKERPILFSAPMVRAILEGRKTQTRGPLKPQFPKDTVHPFAPDGESTMTNSLLGFGAVPSRKSCGVDFDSFVKCPYGVPGNLLWVRETWGSKDADHPLAIGGRSPKLGDRMVYKSNDADDYQWGIGKPSQGGFVWRPSIFMPRWASRITLELTGVRVERVQDISEADATAEGTQEPSLSDLGGMLKQAAWSERQVYQRLWDHINGKREGCAWKDNPWVWVVEFRRISQ